MQINNNKILIFTHPVELPTMLITKNKQYHWLLVLVVKSPSQSVEILIKQVKTTSLTASSIITVKESSLVLMIWNKFQASLQLYSLNQVQNLFLVDRGIIQQIHHLKDLLINQDTVHIKPQVYMHVTQLFFNALLQKQLLFTQQIHLLRNLLKNQATELLYKSQILKKLNIRVF